MRKVVVLMAVQVAVLLGVAAPAFAHGGGGPDATNFVSTVEKVVPAGGAAGDAPGGVTPRVLANDALLEIDNTSGKEVVVEGYSGEPYLRIGPKAVFHNLNSPATYVNQDRFGMVDAPPGLDSTAPPKWEKVKDGSSYAWHDHRIHWMSQVTPTQVTSDPKSPVIEILQWSVPFSVDGQKYEVDGDLNWIRPKSPLPWLLGGLAFTSLPILVGLTKPAGEQRKRTWKRAFAIVLFVLVVLDIIHSVDDILAVPATLAQNVSATAQSALFIAIGAYGAVSAYKARSGAWVGVLLGAFGLALGIGATHLVSLTSSQIASELPEAYTRAVIAASAMALIPAGFIAWRVHEPVLVESTSSSNPGRAKD